MERKVFFLKTEQKEEKNPSLSNLSVFFFFLVDLISVFYSFFLFYNSDMSYFNNLFLGPLSRNVQGSPE